MTDVAQGTYDLLRGRLEDAAKELKNRANELNQRRLETFGSSQLEMLGTERVRTEANAVPRDLASVGDQMILAYNVAAGVKSEIRSTDVFAVHHFELTDGEGGAPVVLSPNPEGLSGTALDDDQFHRDFDELHTYFKETQLQQLYRSGQRLLAVFRIGGGPADVRVFRWQINADNTLTYLDARGERDYKFPSHQDLEWTLLTRADHVGATHIAVGDRIVVNPLGGTFDIAFDDSAEGTLLLSDRLQHADQSLQDCQVSWADGGDIVLLEVLPYGETHKRYYLVNKLTHSALRLDSLGQAFRQLPDAQGLIFPEGIYLKTGELRTFDLDTDRTELLEVVRSPNGEDVLYVFHERETGLSTLLPYNVVRQEVAAPIVCHGHTIFSDGTMIAFREEPSPTRIHPTQIWKTPFCSDEWYEAQPHTTTDLDRVGNAGLVAGIADALSLTRLVEGVEPSVEIYGDLLSSTGRLIDAHHWIGDPKLGNLAEPAKDIRIVAEQVIDEFERMLEVRSSATEALAEAEADLTRELNEQRISPAKDTRAFIDGLANLRTQIGHLHTVRGRREIDTDRVDVLITQATEAFKGLGQKAAAHLAGDGAFAPYHDQLEALSARTTACDSSVGATELLAEVDAVAESMDVVAGTVGDLVVDDPRVRTAVLEQVSGVLAELNRTRVGVENKLNDLVQSETGAAFATELGLFGQSIATAVGRASTPEQCDDSMARLMLQLEQIETAGPRTESQLDEITKRRDQVTEALAGKRQQLVDARQQKAERLVSASNRTLGRISDRASGLESIDEINGFFAADAMVARVRTLVEDLRTLGEPVRADEVQAQLGSMRDEAARALRDRQDLYEGDAIKLGRHRFSVDSRTRELTIVPGEEHLEAVLTGTDLRLPIDSPELDSHRDLWSQPLASETPDLYRSTFLAADIILSHLDDPDALRQLLEDDARMLEQVRIEADRRLDEGYDRGVHDVDAASIAAVIGQLALSADTLLVAGPVRAAAQISWALHPDSGLKARWVGRGAAARGLDVSPLTASAMATELASDLGVTHAQARYLVSELTQPAGLGFAEQTDAQRLSRQLAKDSAVSKALQRLAEDPDGARVLLSDYVRRSVAKTELHLVEEVVAALLLPDLPRRLLTAQLEFEVTGLAGQHPTMTSGVLSGRIDDLFAQVAQHLDEVVDKHRQFGAARRGALADLRNRLRIDDLEPRVPEGFVRNQLIDKVYLPLIGDNLARQIGTVNDTAGARSGLLMLLSPPGYGKTTLVEYLADRLGMALVKVSGPGLGHDATSLDPAQAPSATAAREIERINLAFAVGTNVILYLDDIQHTNPEFLQRFISLCDGQRRIEGVWNGQSRTFDLRGKRFAVVMAGNPYTESGERFRVPDMLANRADTYNLGDVSTGDEDVFASSYLENALTANPALTPLAGAAPEEFAAFLKAAAGEPLAESALSSSYSTAETNEIVQTLAHLKQVQEAVLSVNRQYIASAATDDDYRVEPPFLLQGSYRNMARMASKLVPAMTESEVAEVVTDHYVAESQALTADAESNLLKLGELRGTLDTEQTQRWNDILTTFRRKQRLGGDETDPATRVVAAIEQVAEALSVQEPIAARAIDLLASTAAESRSQREAANQQPPPPKHRDA